MFYKHLVTLAVSTLVLTANGNAVAESKTTTGSLAAQPATLSGTGTAGTAAISPANKFGDTKYLAKQFTRGRMAFLFGEYDTASQILLPLANHGYAKAQTVVGWMYHIGKGKPKDLLKAYNWYQKAAKQNDPIAQNNLGVFYEQGLAVKQNYGNAAKWYRESAEWGYRYGQYNLGMLYYAGRGVPKDPEQAQYWLQIAALQGVNQAIEKLKSISKSVHKNKNVLGNSPSTTPSPTWVRHGHKNGTGSSYHHPRKQGK